MHVDVTLLRQTILASKSISKVVVGIGLSFNSKNVALVRSLIREHEIDTSHFGRLRTRQRLQKSCPTCNMSFETIVGRHEKITCSKKCANTFFRSGRDNPNWVEDNQNAYARICWAHHKKECVICEENLIVAVHHYNGNHSDNRPENLVPLCPTHHQYWHSRHRHLIEEKVNTYVQNFADDSRKDRVPLS